MVVWWCKPLTEDLWLVQAFEGSCAGKPGARTHSREVGVVGVVELNGSLVGS